MGKFPFKRPRIISKKFPEIDSHVESVTKSLEGLVFSYSNQVDRALQKKHVMMAISSLVFLIVLGSFISPSGKAQSSTFYPDTCLGGWINPRHAEGEPQTSSNADREQFTSANSAVLLKNTNADMYCGNFTGKFDESTQPTKILVSLSLTGGDDILLENILISEASTTSLKILENASTTQQPLDVIASSTLREFATSTLELASSTQEASSTIPAINIATSSVPTPVTQEATTIMEGIVESIKDTFSNIFDTATNPTTQTDTVIVPPPAPVEVVIPPQAPSEAPEQTSPEPVSFFDTILRNLAYNFAFTVFAQEISTQGEQVEEGATTGVASSSQDVPVDSTVGGLSASSTILNSLGTTTSVVASSSVTTQATSTQVALDTNQFQNNFLEVLYTFDGTTWQSLGELNEISMKYRTFEIPVTASTSWKDMSQLQIKIASKKQTDDTPTVYLDGIKAEVLYETTLAHVHPDFTRDTILKDETVDGMRIVTIINNDTNEEEIWYMYLDEEVATSTPSTLELGDTSTSTQVVSTTTVISGSSTQILLQASTTSDALSTSTQATSTLVILPVFPKNVWMKFEGKKRVGISARELAVEIKKADENPKDDGKESELPDFALDIIKRIKGTFLNAIIVQIQKDEQEELWLYDIENNTQEKIETGTSTSLSVDSPLGVKGGYVFWLSEDRTQVFAYNLITKEIKSQTVPPHDISIGERGEVVFEGIVWKVIIGANGFSFFSEQTGEVFSDENGSVAEALRQKLKLDTILNKEELSNLNLQVEASETSPLQQ